MILNANAVLSGFVVVLRGIAAVLVICLTCRILSGRRIANSVPSARTATESRFYLLALLSTWLFGLSLMSWPLLYLLLQSYIPQWPGVMCIYGVTRIGDGSVGASRFLPMLIAVLQCLKPAVVFVSGVWLVLYRIQRATRTGPLMSRILLIQLVFGWLALADTVVEGAYLTIPKNETFLFTGCCTTDPNDRFTTATTWIAALSNGLGAAGLSLVFYVGNVVLVAGLWWCRRLCRRRGTATPMGFLLLGAVCVSAVTAAYLVEIAAPTVLRLPYHHCLYDLIPKAPEMVLGLALFALGYCCVGWAAAVHWMADRPETRNLVCSEQDTLLTLGISGLCGALVLVFLEVNLA